MDYCKSEDTIINNSFFDTFWPALLDNDNPCHIECKEAENFIPKQPFNQLHWHTFLAKVGYPNYKKPEHLQCCEKANAAAVASEEEAERCADELAEKMSIGAHGDYGKHGSEAICPIDKQIAQLRVQQERRQKLAYEFANRKYPWQMQVPSHERGFELTSELRSLFKRRMEERILIAIHSYECRLMIIDCGTEICVDNFHRWVKFRPFIPMLVLVRCPRVERHLHLLEVFHTLLIEEDRTIDWHEQLQCSLKLGLMHAKQIELYKTCADPFIFVFSRYRGLCSCDSFKILRRH